MLEETSGNHGSLTFKYGQFMELTWHDQPLARHAKVASQPQPTKAMANQANKKANDRGIGLGCLWKWGETKNTGNFSETWWPTIVGHHIFRPTIYLIAARYPMNSHDILIKFLVYAHKVGATPRISMKSLRNPGKRQKQNKQNLWFSGQNHRFVLWFNGF